MSKGNDGTERRSKARQKFLPLVDPVPDDEGVYATRDDWIRDVAAGFICTSKANKAYYRILIETLWPPGHGIPGPLVNQSELRDAIDRYRKSKLEPGKPYKPYVDVFRRVRELQGEEGLVGVAREGHLFQLVDLNLAEKRVPRVRLDDASWEAVKAQYGHKCAVCRKSEPEVRFDQDHKIPRVRGGGDAESNWMPLCAECNNFKSTSCRGCQLACDSCSWAFPEKYKPLRVSQENAERIRTVALEHGTDPETFLNRLIADAMLNVAEGGS